jgi:hypothetical protein
MQRAFSRGLSQSGASLVNRTFGQKSLVIHIGQAKEAPESQFRELGQDPFERKLQGGSQAQPPSTSA